MLLAVLAHVAGGNHALPTEQLNGHLLANGLAALSPAGQMSPGDAKALDMIPSNLRTIINTLVAGDEVNVRGGRAATSTGFSTSEALWRT